MGERPVGAGDSYLLQGIPVLHGDLRDPLVHRPRRPVRFLDERKLPLHRYAIRRVDYLMHHWRTLLPEVQDYVTAPAAAAGARYLSRKRQERLLRHVVRIGVDGPEAGNDAEARAGLDSGNHLFHLAVFERNRRGDGMLYVQVGILASPREGGFQDF